MSRIEFCNRCKQEREFSPKGCVCKECAKEKTRQWVKNNPEKRKKIARKHYEDNKEQYLHRSRKGVLKQYGLSVEDYDSLLESCGGQCMICGNSENIVGKPNLYVDHCHESGEVRGLLCQKCNSGLGFFRDDPHLLEAALEYLKGVAHA